MSVQTCILAGGGFFVTIAIGLAAVPLVFAGHVLPGVQVGSVAMGGLADDSVPGIIAYYNDQIERQPVTITARHQQAVRALVELGVSLAVPATAGRVQERSWWAVIKGQRLVTPTVQIDGERLNTVVHQDLQSVITLPRNASLVVTSLGQVQLQPGQPGEGVDSTAFAQAVAQRFYPGQWSQPFALTIVPLPAAIQNDEIAGAQTLAGELLATGFRLTYNDQQWSIKPATVRRVLEFGPQPDPRQPGNQILGVLFNREKLDQYLTTTVAPEIDRPAQDARFEVFDDTFRQFTEPLPGQSLDHVASIERINATIAQGQTVSGLAVQTLAPAIATSADIRSLGVIAPIARGESDFARSPANRIHNITVGVARYHGLLIPPQAEFSFNEFLGPVTAAAGFKPELVIKANQTIPEFGGGLCQISTTIFRAAIHAGVPITARRNHAYVVRYYGAPGFDATVYPPNTDLKWRNDTGSYLLLQARIDGPHLTVELWGTPDGRQVTIDGPRTYDRQPDGALKAVLRRTVKQSDSSEHTDTFYSRYRSPQLFPHPTPTPLALPP